MDLNRVAAALLVGTVLVIAVLYMAPVRTGGLDCGNAISPAAQSTRTTPSEPVSDHDRCNDARQSRRNLAHALGAIGLLSAVITFMIEGAREERARREFERHPRGTPPTHT